MDFFIRKMTVEDIPQVQKVAKTSWNHTYDGIIPKDIQENFLKSAYNDEMMKRRIDQSFIYVSEVDGEIVGFANFSPVKEDRQMELGAIYLLPDYQGKGIGSALLHEGIKHAKDVSQVFINVEKDNKIGKAFYDAKGFKLVSEFEENFDGHLLNTVKMVLNV
ncbi:GNAT family N-acetyltransferase [Cytobacillus dafuensis]|uniref:GNAT family N-acetyltransferase n=1 Tax=Cytobacillus dafuensis TaxID=1742359 RepID=A0A5B8Z505_CYTDA|nr:GNAT family N-acetyltransferase [Cytobacillus dafuensis]QED47947.1 GNAT family N-acetyltransferase [Cytobacillus dafuensis]